MWFSACPPIPDLPQREGALERGGGSDEMVEKWRSRGIAGEEKEGGGAEGDGPEKKVNKKDKVKGMKTHSCLLTHMNA